jgi:hypothetical protein
MLFIAKGNVTTFVSFAHALAGRAMMRSCRKFEKRWSEYFHDEVIIEFHAIKKETSMTI